MKKDSSSSEKLIELLEKQLAHSKEQNRELMKQVDSLSQQVRQLTKLLNGTKTEKSRYR